MRAFIGALVALCTVQYAVASCDGPTSLATAGLRRALASSESCLNELSSQYLDANSCVNQKFDEKTDDGTIYLGCARAAIYFEAMYECSTFPCKLILCDDLDDIKSYYGWTGCGLSCKWTTALFAALVVLGILLVVGAITGAIVYLLVYRPNHNKASSSVQMATVVEPA